MNNCKKDISKIIESLALKEGADMIGFAPIHRFDSCPEKTHPKYYMKDARVVIVMGIGYPKSIGKVWGTFEEEHKLPTPYMEFGFAILNLQLSGIALKISKFLETLNYEGIPLPPSYSLSAYRYLYKGDFSIKHAAFAAGLGAFGWNNLFLTSRFGARQRLVAVISNAPIEKEVELLNPEDFCKPELCKYACVRLCPTNALSKDKSQEFIMDRKSFYYAKLDHNLCRWALNGLVKGSGSRSHFNPPEKISQGELEKARGKRNFSDNILFEMYFIDFCAKCMHQCPSPDF